MSSSTSSSEPGARLRRGWVLTALAAFYGGAALLYGTLLALDPYDTGRLLSLRIAGVSDPNLRTADASRGRDARFDAAILGSSTARSIDPAPLGAATGFRFVQLAIPQARPPEVFALLGWFVRQHRQVRAVVFLPDVEWCSADPNLGVTYPFPFWLYGGDGDYLANLLNWKTFDRVAWRAGLWLGRRPATDPVGYSPFVPPGDGAFRPLPPALPEIGPAEAPYPWIERLAAIIGGLPAQTRVAVLLPPVEEGFLPPAGSAVAQRIAGCKAALSRLLGDKPNVGLADDRVHSAWSRDRSAFFDHLHYKAAVARGLEAQIAALLLGGPGATTGEEHDVAGH